MKFRILNFRAPKRSGWIKPRKDQDEEFIPSDTDSQGRQRGWSFKIEQKIRHKGWARGRDTRAPLRPSGAL